MSTTQYETARQRVAAAEDLWQHASRAASEVDRHANLARHELPIGPPRHNDPHPGVDETVAAAREKLAEAVNDARRELASGAPVLDGSRLERLTTLYVATLPGFAEELHALLGPRRSGPSDEDEERYAGNYDRLRQLDRARERSEELLQRAAKLRQDVEFGRTDDLSPLERVTEEAESLANEAAGLRGVERTA